MSNTAGHSYERVSWEGYSLSKWILLIKDKLTLVDLLFLWPQFFFFTRIFGHNYSKVHSETSHGLNYI